MSRSAVPGAQENAPGTALLYQGTVSARTGRHGFHRGLDRREGGHPARAWRPGRSDEEHLGVLSRACRSCVRRRGGTGSDRQRGHGHDQPAAEPFGRDPVVGAPHRLDLQGWMESGPADRRPHDPCGRPPRIEGEGRPSARGQSSCADTARKWISGSYMTCRGTYLSHGMPSTSVMRQVAEGQDHTSFWLSRVVKRTSCAVHDGLRIADVGESGLDDAPARM